MKLYKGPSSSGLSTVDVDKLLHVHNVELRTLHTYKKLKNMNV